MIQPHNESKLTTSRTIFRLFVFSFQIKPPQPLHKHHIFMDFVADGLSAISLRFNKPYRPIAIGLCIPITFGLDI